MKVLHAVELFAPSQGGAQEVVGQLSARLAARGHDVTVATTALEGAAPGVPGVRVERFRASGNYVSGLQGEVGRYRELALTGGFDVVMTYAAQQWTTDALLDVAEALPCAAVLAPCGFSSLHRPAYAGYFRRMPAWMKAFDATVFHSAEYRDIRFARGHGVDNAHVIPNGAAADELGWPARGDIRARLGIGPDELFVLTVGSHTGQKGHAEAAAIFERAGLSNAALVIVGNSFGGGCTGPCAVRSLVTQASPSWRAAGRRILNLELSREDTVAAFHAADVFLFPSLIECSPLVLFEACASRTPFLVTDVGNAREIAGWTRGGLVLETRVDGRGLSRVDVDDGARQLSRLARDRELRARLGDQGHAAWRERFTWEGLTGDYEALYERVANARVRVGKPVASPPEPPLPSIDVLGLRIDGTSYADATARVLSWARRRESRVVCCANVHMVMEARDDASFAHAVNGASLVTPDGMPLVWWLRQAGHAQTRVYGPDLMLAICAAAAREGVSVGLLGGTRATLDTLRARLPERFPGLDIAYDHAPPFRALTDEEDARVVADVARAGVGVLFVGLGCPKQERWMAAHAGRIPAVMVGVGAAFAFHAGEVAQAPAWMQERGLEWLYRLAKEPRRLARRYVQHNPRFAALAAGELMRHTWRGARDRFA